MGSISTLRRSHSANLILSNVIRYLNKNAKSSGKAYLISYLYILIPKLVIGVMKITFQKKYKDSEAWAKLIHLMRNATKPDKFPYFMFKLIFTLNAIDPLLNLALSNFISNKAQSRATSIFLASLISSRLNFPKFQQLAIAKHRFYSLDLSLFVIIRAMDTMVSSLISNHMRVTSALDVSSFAVCSFLIMRAWFYYPERLPPAYRGWITKAANMDYELITALRMLHHGELFYGKPSPHDNVLEPLCDRIGVDRALGRPSMTYPIPCQIVHSNMTESCEKNALIRLARGFTFAAEIYTPLNLALALVSIISGRQKHWPRAILKALLSTARSSSFLALFIAFNWYPICFVRNKLGPFLTSKFPGLIDSNYDKTFAPIAGCALSGLSSLIETAKRRRDLTLFCAPKALLTVIPLEPTWLNLKIESYSFSIFFAILVCYAKLKPSKVRGVYGGGLSYLLKE